MLTVKSGFSAAGAVRQNNIAGPGKLESIHKPQNWPAAEFVSASQTTPGEEFKNKSDHSIKSVDSCGASAFQPDIG